MSKLTKVQQDVLDRLRDGWVIVGTRGYHLRKDGEASRHLAEVTVDSLVRRGLISPLGFATFVLTPEVAA